MTLAEIDAAIAALEKALASGTETVRFADRSKTFRSSKEIRDNIVYFQRKRAELTGDRKSQRFSVVRFS